MRKLNKLEVKMIKEKFNNVKNLINDIVLYVEKYGKVGNTLEQDIKFAKYVIAQKYQ
jgi:hypothetical protein